MRELGDFGAVHTLSDQACVSGLAEVHAAESALLAAKFTLAAEIDRRGLGQQIASVSSKRWYAGSARISDYAAGRHIQFGYWLSLHTSVADALRGGLIHAGHFHAIVEGLATVAAADATLTDEQLADVVAALLELALDATAREVSDRADKLAQAAAADARIRYERRRREDEERRRREDEERRGREDDERRRGDSPGSSGTPAVPPGPDGFPPDGSPTPDSPTPDPAPADSAASDAVPLGPPPVPLSENTALNKLDLIPLVNGRTRVTGDLDKLTAEKLRASLSPLTAPVPGPSGEPDPRTPSQRRADGLSRLLDLYMQGGRSPVQGGVRANVNLIVTLRDLLRNRGSDDTTDCDVGGRKHEGSNTSRERNASEGVVGSEGTGGSEGVAGSEGAGGSEDPQWPFLLSWTGAVSRQLAEMLSCDSDLTPVIVDGAGVPLAMGRTERLVPAHLRAAVVIRDRGCVMCGRAAQWCVVHHVVYWSDGGATDLHNSALVCTECHHLIHDTDWQLLMGQDGHPYSIPPASVDPERTPRPSYHRRRKPAA
ncbi:HNH endonuclease [Rhodococcoides kyotonense]|nr:HNH endonuclease signature motif containing protein [Rhodococcus kyotonensis]